MLNDVMDVALRRLWVTIESYKLLFGGFLVDVKWKVDVNVPI